MCSTARMVVKRKGALRPSVLACTLLPYDERFELGPTLADSERRRAAQPSALRQILRARGRRLQPRLTTCVAPAARRRMPIPRQ